MDEAGMCVHHKYLHGESILYLSKRVHRNRLTGKKCAAKMTVGKADPDRAWRFAHARQ